MISVSAFLLGLLIGSFLNVCIARLPKDESVVRPRSRCPDCGSPIRWFDNIPVASFLWLGGRCRDCGAAISFRYPLVELLTAALFTLLAANSGATLVALKHAVFVAAMVVLAIADLRDRILPDQITLGGAGAGVLFSLLVPLDSEAAQLLLSLFGFRPPLWLASLGDSLLGAAVSSGLLYLVAEAYYRLRFREGMGLGDVKMMVLIGAFLGLRQAFFTVLLASILGAVVGLIFIVLFRKGLTYELPFGTFLAAAAILMVVI